MDNNRNIKILVWNIRGMNSQEKWDAIRAKISESPCHILCLQETKREHFDSFYLKKLCPRNLDRFYFTPSIGAFGGLITIWNSSMFTASLVQANNFVVTVKFDCAMNNNSFHLTNIYGPSSSTEKFGFITWFMTLDRAEFSEWILAGDFNLYRSQEDRKNQVAILVRCKCLMSSSLVLLFQKSLSVDRSILGVTCKLIHCWLN